MLEAACAFAVYCVSAAPVFPVLGLTSCPFVPRGPRSSAGRGAGQSSRVCVSTLRDAFLTVYPGH